MKLLLKREQRAGTLGGKLAFTLDVRADLSADERWRIAQYKLGSGVLYKGESTMVAGTEDAKHGNSIVCGGPHPTVTVSDLENGRRIECKDIFDMLETEQQIKEAAQTFKHMLDACKQFGVQGVIEL